MRIELDKAELAEAMALWCRAKGYVFEEVYVECRPQDKTVHVFVDVKKKDT